jgi:hypothetical protein
LKGSVVLFVGLPDQAFAVARQVIGSGDDTPITELRDLKAEVDDPL